MYFSINPKPYSADLARTEPNYARHFTYGWEPINTNSMSYIKRLLTTFVWSPIIFSGNHRKTEYFVSSRLLVLDFDSPGYSLAQCLREWCDTCHFIGTTKNHQRDKDGVTCDRFRLIAPFAITITDARTLWHNHDVLIKRYDADPAPKDQARLFFPCQEIVSVCADGDLQPVLDAPAPRAQRPLPPGGVPMWTLQQLRVAVAPGKRNSTFYRVAKDLARAGISEEDIIRSISTSPTYARNLTPSVVREIESTTRSALKSIEIERGK